MNKHNLTANELMFIKVLLLAQDDQVEYIKDFLSLSRELTGDIHKLLISLQTKGVIVKSCKIPNSGETLDVHSLEFNKTFLKQIYKSSFDMGKELFDIYPMFVTIGDSTFPLRTVSKKFNTLEDMFKYYAKSISYKEETHNHIIELIKWAKDNTNFLCFNISEFVISCKWEEIEALKSGEGDTNYNFNAIRQL